MTPFYFTFHSFISHFCFSAYPGCFELRWKTQFDLRWNPRFSTRCAPHGYCQTMRLLVEEGDMTCKNFWNTICVAGKLGRPLRSWLQTGIREWELREVQFKREYFRQRPRHTQDHMSFLECKGPRSSWWPRMLGVDIPPALILLYLPKKDFQKTEWLLWSWWSGTYGEPWSRLLLLQIVWKKTRIGQEDLEF